MEEAPGPARNTTVAATSSGVMKRPVGHFLSGGASGAIYFAVVIRADG